MPVIAPGPEGTVTDLDDAVNALGLELDRAADAARDKALRFEVSNVIMELAVEVTADAGAHAGVSFWMIDVGAAGSLGRSAGHTLELTPNDEDGGAI